MTREDGLTRQGFLGAALAAAVGGRAAAQGEELHRRPIPASGETLPVIGLGTWRGFDVGTKPAERAPLREVVATLLAKGGRVIDSSPMYGRAEGVTGDLVAEAGARERTFLATKVWTSGREAGIAQMTRSLQLLRTERLDLMQIHNLLDWRTHLPTLRAWKEEGRIRHLGISHYTESAYDAVEAVLKAERLDVLQINYALDDRAAENTILPLAAERGVAVLVNRPFGGGGLLRRLAGKPLPDYAAELGCATWAEILLKFVVSHPAVTCAIPGTADPSHMAANLRAGTGRLPDEALRRRMAATLPA
ncbi:aldo/keto reductase [Methylobacterium frigidaeris]|uniref:Oxidoreductase/MSMEI_2347 n=1 Tax=Methylobacterium frigidaeris TaxID=2038277 RepID=A0AA37HCJ4_9HYPH|nr:aldo/keto reductase [Methylobacterium frigidaeris]PIK69300.1 aldo/keto reductase [Methylobacterium frigidaeris]GJD63344.1 putative oxidoreductase/MSMEI_2347 [Methylobacterium frigidaeris]